MNRWPGVVRWTILALAAAVLVGPRVHAQQPVDDPAPVRLDNGLTVVIAPHPSADAAVVLVLFSIGELHDPPGRSGLAHMLEHLYVTCPAGRAPDGGPAFARRSADAFMKAYPRGWNAQTFPDHTVIAAVVSPDELEGELRQAGARLAGVTIEPEDLERELPRVEGELANMYGGIPGLGAANRASAAAAGLPEGHRPGGVVEQIKAVPIDDLRERLRTLYTPTNATLVVFGKIDADDTLAKIRDHFGAIVGGERVPAPVRRAHEGAPASDRVSVTPAPGQPGESTVAIAFAPPAPAEDSAEYAAWQIVTTEVFRLAMARGFLDQPFPPRYISIPTSPYTPLMLAGPARDNPEVALEELRRLVGEAVESAARNPARARMMARMNLGWTFGLTRPAPMMITHNPYGVAYAMGRRVQLGLDPAKLGRTLDAVTDNDLRALGTLYLSKDQAHSAVLSVKR